MPYVSNARNSPWLLRSSTLFSAISNPVIHMDYDEVQVKVQWNNRRLINAKGGTRGAKGKGVKNHGTLFLFTQCLLFKFGLRFQAFHLRFWIYTKIKKKIEAVQSLPIWNFHQRHQWCSLPNRMPRLSPWARNLAVMYSKYSMASPESRVPWGECMNLRSVGQRLARDSTQGSVLQKRWLPRLPSTLNYHSPGKH